MSSNLSNTVLEPNLIPIKKSILPAPSHIMIIPDGHRRWSKKYGKPYSEAYYKASNAGLDLIKYFIKSSKTSTLTFYLIAEHTLLRSHIELRIIFEALNYFLLDICNHHTSHCKVSIFGDFENLPKKTINLLKLLEDKSEDNYHSKKLNLLIGYSASKKIRNAPHSNDDIIEPINAIYRFGDRKRVSDSPIIESHDGILLSLPVFFPEVDHDLMKEIFTDFEVNKNSTKTFRIDAKKILETYGKQ